MLHADEVAAELRLVIGIGSIIWAHKGILGSSVKKRLIEDIPNRSIQFDKDEKEGAF